MNSYQLNDDKNLLRLIADDDELAFTEIYNRYWEKLVAIAYNRIKEIQLTEDIVQDVFVSLWENRHASNIVSLENYLATAVKYTVFGKIRSIERAKKFQKDNKLSSVINPQIETALHYKRLLELVATEVEILPEKCKLIFKYSRQNNMPIKEIAGKMKISPKTVENQLNKAIKHLKLRTKGILDTYIFFF